ncbi:MULTISPECIES: ergothioneine biosynthesis glutamate--cysteine ligase EgtA [unclassified Streptomyces]|uniref:ergothioneine biosynthesis glutamate--cysteine ligase EgtA n=1 Tax=unclassified Streptomyces TaxID=2593676 RepID=UPI00081F6929|nr:MULTISPECIES: ergothioneine biosynthesis glutamate--cysteine ligase EgtA [unclassified Streptomyces]MYR29527.1 ergothioneine biosynthesis glutamate--cysteine ligase EgtA [Streptomyces sp. SID4945]SCF46573.1 glutamate--cysteine ligase [Streptomyces sp. LcepLS]
MPDEVAVSGAELEALVRGVCFKTGPPRAVGVEVEWLVHAPERPGHVLSAAEYEKALAAVRALRLSAPLTVEPGGQLELSSLPAPSLGACWEAMREDLAAVRAALAPLGLALTGTATDPWRAPLRRLREPRYEAMERVLDRTGSSGRAMMCCSASVQVCVDAGLPGPGPLGFERRWRLAHLLGPVLVAAFANSPFLAGRATGWRSTRQALWAAIEPGRTAAPPPGTDARTAWSRHVLDTPVMCVRADEGPWPLPEGLTLRAWAREGVRAEGAGRAPVAADLDYHVSTLFPPVRARGHLELRMIDAQPGEDGWAVPLAVVGALFDDEEAAEAAYRAVAPLSARLGDVPPPRSPLWLTAARDGLTDPGLAAAARACFEAAAGALERLGAPSALRALVAGFTERYVARGRCPADDLLAHPFDSLAEAPGLWGTTAPRGRKDVVS